MVEFEVVDIKKDEEIEFILGQAGFIKTVEDLYEAMISSTPEVLFGLAFCEASGKQLVRSEGNDDELKHLAEENALNVGAGHCFLIFFKKAFPINVVNNIKAVPEVSGIYCATANPVQVIIAKTHQGRGIMGIVDGMPSKGIETDEDKESRYNMLRKFGYKL